MKRWRKTRDATQEVLSDPDLMRQIRASERYFARGGEGYSFEEVFGKPLKPPRKSRRRSGSVPEL